jgi:hypothetical protein
LLPVRKTAGAASSFELAKGFTTPVDAFTLINIGDFNKSTSSIYSQNISIDGNGVAVIDAQGKDGIFKFIMAVVSPSRA